MLATQWKGIGAETSACPILRSAHQVQLAPLALSRRKRSFSVSHELPKRDWSAFPPDSSGFADSRVTDRQTDSTPDLLPACHLDFSVGYARTVSAGGAARVGCGICSSAHQLLRHTAVRPEAGCWALRRWRARRRVSGLARARSRRDRRDARGVSSPPPARSRRRRRRVGRDATAGRRKLTTRRPFGPGSASRRSCASWRPPTPERWPW